MAFCPKCGSKINEGATFCGSCGAQVAGAAGTPASAPPGSSPPPGGSTMASNVAGLLCYILGFITGIIFLVVEPYKNDKFVRFHAFQSIFLSVVWIAFRIVWRNILMGMFFTPFFGLWGLFSLVMTLVSLAFLVLWVFLMYKAYNNEKYELPFIGPLAAKQAG
ncbi:MAG: zinc-ribbon domain-containing protein [Terriglobia bacterium]